MQKPSLQIVRDKVRVFEEAALTSFLKSRPSLVIAFGSEHKEAATKLAADLGALIDCSGGSFKSQMKKADSSGAWLAVILGDDEAAAGEATLKPLREDKPQQRVKMEDLPESVGKHLFQDEHKHQHQVRKIIQ